MIKFVETKTPVDGIEALAGNISKLLNDGKKVLWLVSGGSNVKVAVEVMEKIRAGTKTNLLANLTISQTDERYGPVGHKDSNWQQLLNVGFNPSGVKVLPVLADLTLGETTKCWSQLLERAFKDNDICIGQFGMGADGHIAGILKHSPATRGKEFVCAFKTLNFTRITMTFAALEHVTMSYVFVFGLNKKEAVQNLRNKDLSIEEQPAQILKTLPDVTFFTDCLAQ